jgi:flagellar biosynthesis protein FlhB
MMNLEQPRTEISSSFGWQYAMTVLAVMTTIAMGGNTFGTEASGILRYIIAPEETRTIIATKRDSSVAVALLAFALSLLLLVIFERLGARSVVMLLVLMQVS